MVSLPAICPRCGPVVLHGLIGGDGTIDVINMQATCPKCRVALARVLDGTYSLGDQLLSAVRQPGMTKAKIEAFQAAAEAVKSGEKEVAEAAAEAEQISAAFSQILRVVGNNKEALNLLVAILVLLLGVYQTWNSGKDTERKHQDARAQSVATEKQTQALASVAREALKIEEERRQIDERIAQINAVFEKLESSAQPKQAKRSQYQLRTQSVGPNRHARLKTASLAKRQVPPA